jgi:signal transduction histidine kinase
MWRFALFALCGMALMLAAIVTFASRAPQSFLLVAGVFLAAWAIAVAGGVTAIRAQRRDHDRVRRDMMADIAHELRTPLTVMQGTLEGMLDGVYPRDEPRVQQLLDETKVLGRLVEDLRTLTLSESGALTLQMERVDLASLARDVAWGFGSDAAARQIAIDVAAESPPAVDADPVRLRQVIANLVANAIRATPPGGRVTIHVEPAGPNASLSVSDTGRGMTPDELGHIFDRFYKGADSRGSGLGLTIARNIVRLHRGEMQASSERGIGTTVGFTLPLRA